MTVKRFGVEVQNILDYDYDADQTSVEEDFLFSPISSNLDDIGKTNKTLALTRALSLAVLSVQRTLQSTENGKYKAFGSLDLHWLAIFQLDFVAERSEFGSGVDKETVVSASIIHATEQSQSLELYHDLGDVGIYKGLGVLFDSLCNQQERYKPFRIKTWNASSKKMDIKTFWLLKIVNADYQSKEKEMALFQPTNQSYVLLFGMPELDGIDLARINTMRMEMLINRGAFNEALSLADNNARQAQRQAFEIRTLQRQITRSIASVDTKSMNDMQYYVVSKIEHYQKDLESLSNLVMRDHLGKYENIEQENKIRLLNEKLSEQRSATIKLQNLLMELPETYRQNQHKLFRSKQITHNSIPPISEALEKLVTFDHETVNKLADEFLAIISPPVAIDIFDLERTLNELNKLSERKVNDHQTFEIEDINVDFPQEYISDITFDEINRIREWLSYSISPNGEVLSSILNRALNELNITAAVILQGLSIITLGSSGEKDVNHKHRFSASPRKERYSISLDDGRKMQGHDIYIMKK